MSDTIISSTIDGRQFVIETRDGPVTYDGRFLVAALLVFVAKGNGTIEPEESAKMLELVSDHFKMQGAESLELLTRATAELADRDDLEALLAALGEQLSEQEKEDIAVMALKVIAADGRREVSEMEHFNIAVAAIAVSADSVHRAFDRYFSETMPGMQS